MNYNKVIIAGNVTKAPELRTVGDSAVCNLSVAVNKKYKDKTGKMIEKVAFIEASAWGRTAENCAKYLLKGSPVMVEGELEQQTWEDKETGKARSKLTVRAFTVQFLGTKKADPAAEGQDEVEF